jgi:hypothetical protein
MTYITVNAQIAAGNNNAVGLAAITGLSDANGVLFIEPRTLAEQSRGQRVTRANGTVARLGYSRTVWTSNLLLAQWKYLKDTYEGLVTVKLALAGSATFANYNAVLTLQDFEEMTYVVFAGAPHDTGFIGSGFAAAQWIFTRLEAL